MELEVETLRPFTSPMKIREKITLWSLSVRVGSKKVRLTGWLVRENKHTHTHMHTQAAVLRLVWLNLITGNLRKDHCTPSLWGKRNKKKKDSQQEVKVM